MKILFTLLFASCLVASFGFQVNAAPLRHSPQTEVVSSFNIGATIQGNGTELDGGGEVPGPGVPK